MAAEGFPVTPSTDPGARDVAVDIIGGLEYQYMKAGFGADGTFTGVEPGVGLPVAPDYKEVTGAIDANGESVSGGDVSAYRWAQIAVAGTWVGTLRFNVSMDGTTWYNVRAGQPDAPFNPPSSTAANGLWGLPLGARYFRVFAEAWTSGTANIIVGLSAMPSAPTWSQLISGAGSGTLADDTSGFMEYKVGALGMVYDGTTWDRMRSATILDATAGTGLQGVGLIGWDGSLYRRVRTDASGYLQTDPVPLTAVTTGKTTVTTAGTRVQLPANAASGVIVKASRNNANTIYVGNSAVAASNGFELDPGDVGSARLSNTNLLYVDAAASGDYVTWWVVA